MASSGTFVIARMQSIIDDWEAVSDGRRIFLSCYRMMTENMLAGIDGQEFIDPAWTERLLCRFSDYYFLALEAYNQDPGRAPTVWALAHHSAQFSDTTALQNLLLGVNAHINYDLVLTLVDLLQPEWSELDGSRRQERYTDYCQVNTVIGRTIDAVQDQVIEPVMPEMNLLDHVLGPFDELLISRTIRSWREAVWQNTIRLLAVQGETGRAELLGQIEGAALALGNSINTYRLLPALLRFLWIDGAGYE